ncbi:MAG: hypothetical protein RR335_10590 [Eubacterium sp.]
MERFGTTRFGSGFVMENEKIGDACDAVMDTLKKELPEEAQSFEVISYVLGECSDILEGKQLKL